MANSLGVTAIWCRAHGDLVRAQVDGERAVLQHLAGRRRLRRSTALILASSSSSPNGLTR